MERRTFSTGTPWDKVVAYSRAVRMGSYVFVSGTTASTSDGTTVAVGNACQQTVFNLRKTESARGEVGATMADVARTRMFVTDISRWEEIGRAHGEVFARINPAATVRRRFEVRQHDREKQLSLNNILGCRVTADPKAVTATDNYV